MNIYPIFLRIGKRVIMIIAILIIFSHLFFLFFSPHSVNGLLFVNLTDDEIQDLGITNKFHIRKLQLMLKAYRIRYQIRKERRAARGGNRGGGGGGMMGEEEDDDEDELLSEYSPSELSAIIAAEDGGEGRYGSDMGSSEDVSCFDNNNI
jgi:hypothetical protein